MTDNTERAQVGWGFWRWWVLASIVGFAVGFAVIFAVFEAMRLAEGSIVIYTVAFTVAGVLGGAVYGAITGGVLVWFLRGSPDPPEAWSREPWYRWLFGGRPE